MGKYIFQAFLTPEDEGGYSVEFPDLPGCFSCGDTFHDAVAMGADAAKTYRFSAAEKQFPGPSTTRAPPAPIMSWCSSKPTPLTLWKALW